MKKKIAALMFFVLVSACSTKAIDIKSPCVSKEDGPCGPKRLINEWWLKNSQDPKNPVIKS